MRRPSRAAIALSLLAPWVAAAVAAQERCDRSPILVRNARLWTPDGTGPARDILFESGRVARVGPARSIAAAPGTRVLDGAGQTVLPGLVDLHVHLGVPGGLPGAEAGVASAHWSITGRQLLRSGVTRGRLHFTSLAASAELAGLLNDPCAPIPELALAAPAMAGGAPAAEGPTYAGVKNADDATARVRRAGAAGLGWVALHDADRFSTAELDGIVTAAHSAHIRLMGGAGSPGELAAVVAARVDTIDSLESWSTGLYSDAQLALLAAVPDATLVPTLGYHLRIQGFDRDPRLIDAPANYEFQTPEEKEFVAATAREALRRDSYIVKSRDIEPLLRKRFRQLLATGHAIATGTDAGSAAHFHAGAIWWELQAWHAFGASRRAALVAATATAARVLGDERTGTLREGARADFVLYAGNVERGRFDLARVRAVAKAGVLFVRDGAWIGPGRLNG